MTDHLHTRPVLALVLLAALVGVPLSVQAGLFSYFFPAVEGGEAEEVVYAIGSNAQTLPLLKAALHTDPNPAKGGGDVIVEDGALVPYGDFSGEDSDVNSRTANGEISIYTVRPNDTPSQIAEMFDITLNTLLWANNIKDPDIIRPGDELVILPITGVRHVVKEGDTIGAIAKKYDGEVEDILSYNQLSSVNEISVGDTIVIPGGEVAAPAPTRSATPTRTSGSTVAVSGGGSSGYIHPVPGAQRSQGLHGYNGVDLAAPSGTGVRAAASGNVIVAKAGGWNGGYGSYIVIKHGNGTQTLYAHLSSVEVSAGQAVAQGARIGGVGNTGRSTGNHLHFEVRGARNPF